MADVPGCAESRTGELGPGKCQSDAGAPGPEEKAAGGGKESEGVFYCVLSYIFNSIRSQSSQNMSSTFLQPRCPPPFFKKSLFVTAPLFFLA